MITCLAVVVLPVSTASAAEVFTNNKALEGSVVGVTAEGAEFETIYGKGTVVIPWKDVQNIRSDKEFLIPLKDANPVVGRIWDLKNRQLLVGTEIETAVSISVDQILRSITRRQYETSIYNRKAAGAIQLLDCQL